MNCILMNQLRHQLRQRQNSIFAQNESRIKFLSKNNFCNGSNYYHHNYHHTIWDSIREKCNEKLILLGQMLTAQCNFYASLRIRRMAQICGLYNRIYSERSVHKLVYNFVAQMHRRAVMLRQRNNRSKSIKFLLSAASGVFCWEKEKITDCEIKKSIEEFVKVSGGYNKQAASSPLSVSASSNSNNGSWTDNIVDTGWESVIMRENLKVWRKLVPNTSLYQYKGN
jgi:hypothetical protein